MNADALDPDAGVALVFGATGGIGEALLERLKQSGRYKEVLGFSRGGVPALDLCNEESIAAAAETAAAGGAIRLAIDATGFLHDQTKGPEKTWRDLDAGGLAQSFALNAIGPALLIKHVMPLFPRTGRTVFASLSARVGSIGDNRLGGWYGYRASKAALNQIVRTAAIELARRRPEAICVALHPGTVATGLSAPFTKRGLDVQTPAAAAARLLSVVDALTPDHNGGFFDQHGKPIPW